MAPTDPNPLEAKVRHILSRTHPQTATDKHARRIAGVLSADGVTVDSVRYQDVIDVYKELAITPDDEC